MRAILVWPVAVVLMLWIVTDTLIRRALGLPAVPLDPRYPVDPR